MSGIQYIDGRTWGAIVVHPIQLAGIVSGLFREAYAAMDCAAATRLHEDCKRLGRMPGRVIVRIADGIGSRATVVEAIVTALAVREFEPLIAWLRDDPPWHSEWGEPCERHYALTIDNVLDYMQPAGNGGQP